MRLGLNISKARTKFQSPHLLKNFVISIVNTEAFFKKCEQVFKPTTFQFASAILHIPLLT